LSAAPGGAVHLHAILNITFKYYMCIDVDDELMCPATDTKKPMKSMKEYFIDSMAFCLTLLQLKVKVGYRQERPFSHVKTN
jgi:hypothetical protein